MAWVDLYFVGNVKTGRWGFPLDHMKQTCATRGDTCFLKREWPVMPARQAESAPEGARKVMVYAASHCDKKPTNLVATRGTSLAGIPATRYFRKW